MERVSRFILVDAPQSEVFEVIADYRTLPEIQPQFKTVRPVGEREYGLGAKLELQGSLRGLPLTATMTIVEFDPPRLIVSDSRGGVDSFSTWRFSTVTHDDGREMTRAALAIEYKLKNPALALVAGLVRREVEQLTEQSLRRLKQMMEKK